MTASVLAQTVEPFEVIASVNQPALTVVEGTPLAIGAVDKGVDGVADPTDNDVHTGCTPTIGILDIEGEAGANVDVQFGNAVLGHATLSHSMAFTTTMAAAVATQPSITISTGDDIVLAGTVGGAGTYTLWMGGTLAVDANQFSGDYSTANTGNGGSPVTVTLTYF